MIATARPLVIKAGGKEIVPDGPLPEFVRRVAALVRTGRPIVIVHGGGDEVTERAGALGLPTEKRAGQRITSAPMLEIVLEVLGGRVNARLVGALGVAGVAAVGVSGLSDRLLLVRPAGSPPGSLGFVGEPVRVRPSVLSSLLGRGFVPVVAPLGADASGQAYNVNADLAAGAIARALRADLFLVTDVPGVLAADGHILRTLTVARARELVAEGVARDGMVPKLEAAERALTPGSASWIGDLPALGGDPPTGGTRILPGARPPAPAALGRLARTRGT
ncbi:MAG: acetylglutamate kinase [Thermoplasmata archaeon]|nr:acetylglutamate kinase [Thermoplasmata archaeon]